jgi:predicted hotdog family 3-hydroxylacyl-ACP dehydratase
MCLLDSVEEWNGTTITCRTSTHRDRQNPLRRHGRLMVSAGLEYAAQAMGAHIGLLERGDRPKQRIGYVGSVRDVTFAVEHLDTLAGELTISATRMVEGDNSYMYVFAVNHGSLPIIEGRASIFVRPEPI